jgi:uncharacterized protein with FMN-binding domain
MAGRGEHSAPAGPGPVRVRHVARGARATALAASIGAMGSVAFAIAYSEGAFDVDGSAAVQVPTGIERSLTTALPSPGLHEAGLPALLDGPPSISEVAPSPDTTAADGEPSPVWPLEDPSGWRIALADGVYLGPVESMRWGEVQVEVTVAEGIIVEAVAVQAPGGRSQSWSDRSVPHLERAAIEIQDAAVDIVSGATYTSVAYVDSLQAALDLAAVDGRTPGSEPHE